MKKKFFKIVLFVLIFLIIFDILTWLFVRKGNGYGSDVISFYNEPKNSLDVIFFGSSHSYTSFNPQIIAEETGLKSYNFATQQQPIWITYYYMIEALKYQKPKIFVLDIHMLTVDDTEFDEGVYRDAIDKMRLSKNKIDVINDTIKNPSDRVSYYFNLIKYHSRWNELKKSDFEIFLNHKPSVDKGFTNLENVTDVGEYAVNDTLEIQTIISENEKYLNKIIELTKKNNIKLIMVKTPCNVSDEMAKKYNYIESIAKNNNIYFINYNKIYDEIELNFQTDFYDYSHLNGKGAEKLSSHFASILLTENK